MTHCAKIPLYAATILALSVVPSLATTMTFDLGALSGSGFKVFGDGNLVGVFQDYYKFSIPGTTGLSDSVTNSYTISAQNIAGLRIDLFEGTLNTAQPNGGGTLKGSAAASNTGSPAVGSNQATLLATISDAGNYYFEVSANPGSTGSAVYSGNLAYSVMPLPSGLPMLSGAILALAAAGHLVTKRRKNLSAAA